MMDWMREYNLANVDPFIEAVDKTRRQYYGTRKLLGLMKAKKVLIYTPLLKRYLDHGLNATAFHQFLKFQRSKPSAWFLRRLLTLEDRQMQTSTSG